MHYDVFNGDADGICALIQLRLDQPLQSELVTGVKRDIQLLDKISVNSGDSLTVLDISFKKNSRFVVEFLAVGAEIFYVDHHQPGPILVHPNLKALISTDESVCTSLLINEHLNYKFPLWATTAAFGDNLNSSAEKWAKNLQLSTIQVKALKHLGVYVNYNAYGDLISDLHFAPDDLYREMACFESPFEFIEEKYEVYGKLEHGYRQDMSLAETVKPDYQTDSVAVFILPDESWARRVSGVFGNYLVNKNPALAYAVMSRKAEGGYLVSVRSPLNSKAGADKFCSTFDTGGGRKSAAGINHLPDSQLGEFVKRFDSFLWF